MLRYPQAGRAGQVSCITSLTTAHAMASSPWETSNCLLTFDSRYWTARYLMSPRRDHTAPHGWTPAICEQLWGMTCHSVTFTALLWKGGGKEGLFILEESNHQHTIVCSNSTLLCTLNSLAGPPRLPIPYKYSVYTA